jgi:hypothetical protein
MDAPQWLYDLMDLLGLDILEQANWVRRWNGDADSPTRRLGFKEVYEAKSFLAGRHKLQMELSRRGLLGEREALMSHAQEMGVGFVDLDRVLIEPPAFQNVSRNLVTDTGCIPVKRDGSTLWLAMSSDDMAAIDAYKLATGCRVVPVLAVPDAIEKAIEKYFPDGGQACSQQSL